MNEQFSEILRNYVKGERQKNPSANETALAKKMDIPTATFNRLINGHFNPNTKTILKLSQFIPAMKKLLPKDISQVLEISMKRDFTPLEESLEALLYDKNVFLCWSMAFAQKGITEKEVKDSLGQQGVKALKTLEQNKIIEKNENLRYKVIEKNKDTILSFRLMKAHLMFLAEQYKPDNLDKNYIYYWVDSLNKEGWKKVMRIHQEAHKKVQKVMDSEEYKGDISGFSIGCSDMLSDK